MVARDLGGSVRGGVDDRPVPGVHDRRSEIGHPAQRGEIAAKRIGGRVRPAADVGRDLVEQHVAADQPAAAPVMEGDVAVGMAGQVEHAPGVPARFDDVVLVHEAGGDGELDGDADLGPRRRRGEVGRHAVVAEVALVVGVVALLPPPRRPGPGRAAPARPAGRP